MGHKYQRNSIIALGLRLEEGSQARQKCVCDFKSEAAGEKKK